MYKRAISKRAIVHTWFLLAALRGNNCLDCFRSGCRYRRLYNAAIKDRAVTYAWFFLMYLIHIAFCIWSAVSPPLPGANDWSHTGFIACIKAFHASKFVGVVYTIGGVLWALESLWSFWVLKVVSMTEDTTLCSLPASRHFMPATFQGWCIPTRGSCGPLRVPLIFPGAESGEQAPTCSTA